MIDWTRGVTLRLTRAVHHWSGRVLEELEAGVGAEHASGDSHVGDGPDAIHEQAGRWEVPGPPEHWLERVRRDAPQLLDGRVAEVVVAPRATPIGRPPRVPAVAGAARALGARSPLPESPVEAAPRAETGAAAPPDEASACDTRDTPGPRATRAASVRPAGISPLGRLGREPHRRTAWLDARAAAKATVDALGRTIRRRPEPPGAASANEHVPVERPPAAASGELAQQARRSNAYPEGRHDTPFAAAQATAPAKAAAAPVAFDVVDSAATSGASARPVGVDLAPAAQRAGTRSHVASGAPHGHRHATDADDADTLDLRDTNASSLSTAARPAGRLRAQPSRPRAPDAMQELETRVPPARLSPSTPEAASGAGVLPVARREQRALDAQAHTGVSRTSAPVPDGGPTTGEPDANWAELPVLSDRMSEPRELTALRLRDVNEHRVRLEREQRGL